MKDRTAALAFPKAGRAGHLVCGGEATEAG